MALDLDALRKNLAARQAKTLQSQNSAKSPSVKRSAWTGQRGHQKPDTQREFPHSVEAEQGVLGSMLNDPACIPEATRACQPWFLYVPAHRTIFQALSDHWDSGAGLDLITFTQFLRDKGLLDNVGGAALVTQLYTFVRTSANVQYYLEIVREKAILRELISVGNGLARAAHGTIEGDRIANLLDDYSRKIERIKSQVAGPNGSELFSFSDLMEFDSKHDPNCLVGNRYIVRGGSSLWAGGSGYGKSSLLMQLAIYWACGRSWCNLRPVRPLKSLIVQAENDKGDMSEQLQGVIAGIDALGEIDVQESRDLIEKNVGIHRVVGKSGPEFLVLLDMLCEIDRPDICWIDPLFAFSGCDLMNAEKTGRFLRGGLFTIADKRKVAFNVIHHAGKPLRGDDKANSAPISEIDFQYLGFGTSEIQNAFRAVNVLMPMGSGVYKLVLSKRGERAGAKGIEGEWTRTLFLQQGREGISWAQCEEPVDENGPGVRRLSNLMIFSVK